MKYRAVPRLLMADDHRLFSEACKKMLEPTFETVAIVTDGRALVEKALEMKPNAAILEVALPGLNGLDAAEQLSRKLPSAKLVFLTTSADPAVAAEAFRRGASGYLPKHAGAEELLLALRRVMRGESYLSPLVAGETVSYLLRRPDPARKRKDITGRQAEILQLLAEGRSMKEAAYILNISPGTVAFHKYEMMDKLGITSNAGLLLYAMKRLPIAS